MSSRKVMAGLLFFLASLGAAASENPAPRADWLVGTWVLCEDPDSSPRDSLQFNTDGTGLVRVECFLLARPEDRGILLQRLSGG